MKKHFNKENGGVTILLIVIVVIFVVYVYEIVMQALHK